MPDHCGETQEDGPREERAEEPREAALVDGGCWRRRLSRLDLWRNRDYRVPRISPCYRSRLDSMMHSGKLGDGLHPDRCEARRSAGGHSWKDVEGRLASFQRTVARYRRPRRAHRGRATGYHLWSRREGNRRLLGSCGDRNRVCRRLRDIGSRNRRHLDGRRRLGRRLSNGCGRRLGRRCLMGRRCGRRLGNRRRARCRLR
jgi:hypothetical protein